MAPVSTLMGRLIDYRHLSLSSSHEGGFVSVISLLLTVWRRTWFRLQSTRRVVIIPLYVCLIGLTTKKKSEAVTNWSTMSAVPFRRPPRGVKQSDSARSTHWRRAGPFTWHSFSLFHWPWARIWRAVAGAVPGRPVYWSAWFTKCSKTSSLSTAKWATSTATSCCAKPGATSATTSPSDCCLHGGGATAQSTKTTTSVNRPKRKSRLTRRRKRRRKNGSHGYDPTISHVPLFLRSSFRKLLGQTRRAVGYCLVKMQKAMGNAISVKW